MGSPYDLGNLHVGHILAKSSHVVGGMMASIGNQPTIYLVEWDGIGVFLMPWGEEFGGKLVRMRFLWDFSWRFNTGIHLDEIYNG